MTFSAQVFCLMIPSTKHNLTHARHSTCSLSTTQILQFISNVPRVPIKAYDLLHGECVSPCLNNGFLKQALRLQTSFALRKMLDCLWLEGRQWGEEFRWSAEAPPEHTLSACKYPQSLSKPNSNTHFYSHIWRNGNLSFTSSPTYLSLLALSW